MITGHLIGWVTALLFLGSLLMIELGYGYRLRWLLGADEGSSAGIGSVSATVLSLMGLVLAFSFSNAAGRLDASAKSILNEVTAIESAWQRINLVEPQEQHRLKVLFRDYVEARVRAYEALPGLSEYARQSEIAEGVLNEIWPVAIEGTSVTANRTLLVTALDAMSDAAAVRNLSLNTHIPTMVLLFLFGIVLAGSLLVGTMLGNEGNRQWFYRLMIAAVLTSVVSVIIDLEYPRQGMFNLLKEPDTMFVDLRKLVR
jgi:hypothetical protein